MSDDQTGQAQAQKATPEPRQDEEGLEAKGVADNEVIADTARAQKGGALRTTTSLA